MKQPFKQAILFFGIVLFTLSLHAQDENFWKEANEKMIGKDLFAISKSTRPSTYKIFELDETGFRAQLQAAPSENDVRVKEADFIVHFPNAQGKIERYRVEDAPVMAQDLARKYPGIHAYAGIGIDHPGSTVRFDVSVLGTHVTILSPNRPTIYIDKLDGNYYRVVSRQDMVTYNNGFTCKTEETTAVPAAGTTTRPANADDGKLRIYRLALASGGEFSQFWLDGTEPDDAARIAKVLIAQNSVVTRVNATYERDFGVRLQLIANNDQVIYLNPATDPIANPNSPSNSTMHTAITNAIGSANFDVGHTESKGNNNGNAGCIGCVCVNSSKARGWTVYSNPSLLDFYVVDYLAHELGHQFGANHTFSFNTEGTGVNVEPGSGVTIMGYAGITGSTDVAPHSIDIFHTKSIEQVTDYIKTGNGSICPVINITGNTAPTADAGADHIIPKSTPFALTGTGTDIDATDVLTYNWEQIDSRTTGGAFPVASATTGPMFRPYLPTTSPVQIFPQLQYILTGANGYQWEVLPSSTRALNFRFIVRDNHAGGGNNQTDDMTVNVTNTSGPFGVSIPNTAVSWVGNSTQTITWTVNNSDLPPVNCSNVNILLSTDGGYTFPVTLAANTPNDGAETITVPNMAGTHNRVKVESVGNIFFDISNADFTITAPVSGFNFGITPPITINCAGPVSAEVALPTTAVAGFATAIQLSATAGVPAGTTVSFSPASVTPGATANVILNNANTLGNGTYNITVTGTAGNVVQSTVVSFVVSTAPINISTQPTNVEVCLPTNSTSFSVGASAPGLTYQWQVSTNNGASFTNIPGESNAALNLAGLVPSMNGNQYRVVLDGLCSAAVNSAAATLLINSPAKITAQPVDVVSCTGTPAQFRVTATGSSIGYQWQVSEQNGPFVNVSNNAPYSGATTAVLNVDPLTVAVNGNRFRVIVAGIPCGSDTSAPVNLVVNPLPVVTLAASSNPLLDPGTRTLLYTTVNPAGNYSYQWYRNGVVVPSLVSDRIEVSVDELGSYEVTATDAATGCGSRSNSITVGSSISGLLFLYPNPSTGQFQARFYSDNLNTVRTLSIYDSKGARVYKHMYTVNSPYTKMEVNLTGAASGVYLVELRDAKGSRVAKGKLVIRK